MRNSSGSNSPKSQKLTSSIWLFAQLIILICPPMFPGSVFALEPVSIQSILKRSSVGKHIEFLEDKTTALTIDHVREATEWKQSTTTSVTSGFTKSAYWYRFAIRNESKSPSPLFFEISYPLLNYIDFYSQSEEGYAVVKTGNRYPFRQRDVIDKNFVFKINPNPGITTYYFRIETSGSLNFTPSLLTQDGLLEQIETRLPIVWIHYGLMVL